MATERAIVVGVVSCACERLRTSARGRRVAEQLAVFLRGDAAGLDRQGKDAVEHLVQAGFDGWMRTVTDSLDDVYLDREVSR